MTPEALASRIDHTLLKGDLDRNQLEQLCAEAAQYRFASICIPPCWVPVGLHHLTELGAGEVAVCTVIGFPFGYNLVATKAFEAEVALRQGARELDMVINVGAARSGEWAVITAEIRAVVQAAQSMNALVKVILECASLTEAQKRQAAQIALNEGADFLKTSTGYGPGGATIEDVRLLRKLAGDKARVKAAGGIRDLPTALAMLEAGADRLGTSSGVALMRAAARESEQVNDRS